MLTRTELDQKIALRRAAFEDTIRAAVEIPTISMDPAHKADMARGAEWAADLLRSHGAEARIVETPGYPVVHGRLAMPGATRSIAIYNHLDVQPAGEPEWQTEPFRLQIAGDKYIGRGATDDKGPAITALFAAKMAQEAGIPLEIHFFWELEEEIGSPHFDTFLKSAPKVDSVLVSDTIWISRQKPAAPLGLRGMQTVRLVLRTGKHDAHSGLTGGPARNPIAELCDLIAAMVDGHTGDVKIPGFYDDVRSATAEEINQFVSSGFDRAEFQRVHGFHSLRYTEPADITRRIWALPTLEVHGIAGGYQGPGVKSVIPPWAEAKISMRLVPDMSPQRTLKRLIAFVHAHNPDVEIHAEASLEPYLAPTGGPLVDCLRRSLAEAFGAEPAFVREGGSIGAVVQMQRALGCPVMFLGLSLPEHGYHAPNEFFGWGMASGGMKAFLAYLREVAALS